MTKRRDSKKAIDPVDRARSLGFSDEVLARWTPGIRLPAPFGAAEKKGSKVFHLDGPIVSDENYEWAGEPESGLVAPSRLRAFLDDAGDEDISIEINTPGGNVWAATSMMSDLLRHQGTVDVVVTGVCASAGNFFLTLRSGDRMAMPNTEFMIHNVFTIAVGDYKDFEKLARNLKKSSEGLAKRLAASTNLSIEELTGFMDSETWFTAEEALEHGFVDSMFDEGEDESDESDESEEQDQSGADEMEAAVPDGVRRAERLRSIVSI